MATHEIVPGVFSVGTVDWNLRYFDALMPTPRGTTYNAFLVRGSEKTALVDGTKPNEEADFITNLMRLDQHALDYLVINHAEQDHTAILPLLLEVFPGAKVVTNETCKGLLMAMHHLEEVEDRFLVVGDREELSLGDKTLRFYLAPWVHWPDTMFTEVVEDRVLFTTDFLGVHYASPTVFAEETPEYFEAAKRYYAAIMMPFRSSVQDQLKLLEEINPSFICPSHGPLLKTPAKIVDRFREWSGDQPANLVVVCYVSMHGSTELMTRFLVDDLVQRGIPVLQLNLLETDSGVLGSAVVDAATIILGTPTVLFGPHPVAVNAAYLIRALCPKARHLGILGSYGWGTNAVNYLSEMLAPLDAEVLDPVYIRGIPDEGAISDLRKLADEIEKRHKNL
jgi:flavorubredoxin